MTLSEYIRKEFGIIPDETQIEEIKETVIKDYLDKIWGKVIVLDKKYLISLIHDKE